MDDIAKNHDDADDAGQEGSSPDAFTELLWCHPQHGVVARISAALAALQAHPATCVVLLPYAQLLPLARRMWQRCRPQGFAPRFETTLNWSQALGPVERGVDDLRFDAGLDSLTARSLLERAGLAAQRETLCAPLLEAAAQLAPLAAAVPPGARPQWAAQARQLLGSGAQSPLLMLENVAALIAVEWAATSAYATDILWDPARGVALVDALVVLNGLEADPLTQALLNHKESRAVALPLIGAYTPAETSAVPALHACADAEDEAQRAAACVLVHIAAGRTPVALAATDRALTRRVRAMLGARRMVVRDENGWKLSTTRAAALLMGALRACSWNASSDAVLDWLKNAPSFAPTTVQRLEKELRKAGVPDWRAQAAIDSIAKKDADIAGLLDATRALRDAMQPARPLAQWLLALRQLLEAGGQWAALAGDEAGAHVQKALRLLDGAQGEVLALPQAARRMNLADFSAWVNEVLEAGSFKPEYPDGEQVVVLPLSQLLARPFAAVVLPGCDEVRLSPAPEPAGVWTTAQRTGLGLPSREALEAAARGAWQHALQRSAVDVLWRVGDDAGEPLLPSPLVQALLLGRETPGSGVLAPDPRQWRPVASQPVSHPQPALGPHTSALAVQRLSATAYEDLRKCPYRFFALRQLGLKTDDELESEVDKRDFGLWLHAVLRQFHEALHAQPVSGRADRVALLNARADAVTAEMALSAADFLPFAAAWPQVREGYLDWLAKAEAEGTRFESAESWHEMPLGDITLRGQVDRIDLAGTAQQGNLLRLVIDYKTESQEATRKRIKEPFEDTQLAFYATLLPDDTLRAAYLNVGEKDGTKLFEQQDLVAVRDALIEGVTADLARIAGGHPMPALGDGRACEFCDARGLCRKDFWHE